MRALVAALVLTACGDHVPPPPGTRIPEPVPAPAPPVAPDIEMPPPECRVAADCRLTTDACRNTLVAVRAGEPDRRPPYLPAHSCRRLDRQVPVAPSCIDGRCALVELDAPELRTCGGEDECILAPFACHTTPIRADAREAFAAFSAGAHCARWVPEGAGACMLGVCIDPAWRAE